MTVLRSELDYEADELLRLLEQRAVANGRSMEAEARAILIAAVAEKGAGAAWREMASRHGFDALPASNRSLPRDLDF